MNVAGAECQEPDDSATRKYQDELFKSETTETTNTDINTTLSSTEIENNSTNTETNDAVDAANDLDENEELSSTRDEDQSSEWTTMPPTHEYSISINDVLKKSIDVVKDEMKGFGIIQSWLKEQANEFVSGTTTEDYDYTQTTDDYTVNEIYDDEEAGNGNGTTTEIVNVQKESEDLPPVENELNVKEESSTEKIKDTIEKIEDDLKKLNRVQAEEKEEEEEREEIIQDIEENLNKLEASSSHDQTTQSIVTKLTTDGTAEFVEFEIATTATPGIILEEIEEEEQGETTTILMQPELFTTENAKMVEFAEVVFEDEETLPQATTTEREIVKEGTEKEEDTTVMITIIDEINSEDSITSILESSDEIEEETITVNIVDDRTVTTENIATTESVFITTTENITTTESSIITTEIISSEMTTEGHITTMIETTNAPSTTTEVEMEITTMPEEQIIIVTETETTVTEEKINENDEKEEEINENNEEDEEINENNEKEDEDVTLKNIPVTNVESTEANEIPSSTTELHNSYDIVNEVVDEIIHEIKENDLTSSTPSEEPTKISIDQFLHALNSNSMEDANNNDNNEDSNELLEENKTEIASNEEVFDDIDKERKKILADHNSSEDNTLDDVELAVDVDQFSEEEVVEKVGDPKVSALITDRMDGNVCLNASGLSIKITTNVSTTRISDKHEEEKYLLLFYDFMCFIRISLSGYQRLLGFSASVRLLVHI